MAVQITPLFAPTQLTGAAATIYTLPSAPTTLTLARGRARFTNTDTAARAVTAYAVPVGGTAGAGNAFMNAVSIAPNAYLDVDLPVLAPGGFIQAFADVTLKVTMFCIDGILFS